MTIVFTILSSATFGCVASIDNFYAASLPQGNCMSGKNPVPTRSDERVYVDDEDEFEELKNDKKWKVDPKKKNIKVTNVQRCNYEGAGNY